MNTFDLDRMNDELAIGAYRASKDAELRDIKASRLTHAIQCGQFDAYNGKSADGTQWWAESIQFAGYHFGYDTVTVEMENGNV